MTKTTQHGRFGTKPGKKATRKRAGKRLPGNIPNKGKRVKMVQPISSGPAGPVIHINPDEYRRIKPSNP